MSFARSAVRAESSGPVTDSGRRRVLRTASALLLSPLMARAQSTAVKRIGYLAPGTKQSSLDGYSEFLGGMRDLGYVEGRDFVMETRLAGGKMQDLPTLAADLVRSNVAVIVAAGSYATQAAKQATAIIPIVMGAASDPVSSGLVASLARPGGNVTGLSLNAVDVSPKHVELLKSVMPAVSRVALLINPTIPSHHEIQRNLQAAAQSFGIAIVPVQARNAEEIGRAFATMRTERAEALIVVIDSFFSVQREQIIALAAQNRLPSVFPYRQLVEIGGLLSYGQDLSDAFRRAASYVDRILKGAKPAELPVEQPTKFEMAINLKTAAALGIVVPRELLLRADKVFK